jgi:O-antigen ligase
MNVAVGRTDLPALVVARASWVLVALVAALLLQSIYHQPVGWAPGSAVAALAVFAALRPFQAVLLLGALGPLAGVIFVLISAHGGGLRFAEALALACIAGWSARRAIEGHPLRVSPWLRWTVMPLIAAALASSVVYGAVMLAEDPSLLGTGILPAFIVGTYLVDANPVSFAMLFAESLVLLLVVADTCAADGRRREALLRMMVIGAAAAALMNLLRIVEVAMKQGDGWAAFLPYLATLRVNVHYGDLNAAGSYFSMMLLVAAGLAGRLRIIAMGSALLIGTALWITGSRTAMGAALGMAVLAGLMTLRERGFRRNAPVIAALVLLAAVTFAAWSWSPQRTNSAAARWSLSTRIELAKAAGDMAAAHPFFGIGLGRFYMLSNTYVGEMLAAQGKQRENAHNYFLQVLAELGVPGLLLFLSVIALALRAGVRGAGPPGPSWGLIAGLCAFLLTCFGGHPLLVPAAAYPFWIALGVAASLGGVSGERWRVRLVGIVLVAAFVCSIPFRTVAAVREADVENTSVGFSLWQRGPDGSRFRWAGDRATFFVPSSARAVRIPLRHGSTGPDDLEVRIFLDGREADRVRLSEVGEWRILRLVLVQRKHGPFARIDLEAGEAGTLTTADVRPTNTGGMLMVGRPIIEE